MWVLFISVTRWKETTYDAMENFVLKMFLSFHWKKLNLHVFGFCFFSEFHVSCCRRWWICKVVWFGRREMALWVQSTWNQVNWLISSNIFHVIWCDIYMGALTTLLFDCRVKGVDSFLMEDHCVLVTASNDGFIKMWKLSLKEACLL